MKKNIIKKRVSNRRYPERICKKPDCQEGFVPSDARQIYCCEQHRVDFNNDKRKLKDSITLLFLKKVKANRDILEKIAMSEHYKKHKRVHKSLLDFERYDYNYYHFTLIDKSSEREAHVCFEYTLALSHPQAQYYIIDTFRKI